MIENLKMAKIITLGEIMLRLSTKNNLKITQATDFDAVYGGGEANVAVSCANFGHDVYFFSKVPDNELGKAVINNLRQYGIHTQYIAKGGRRLGIYFLEEGDSIRPSKLIYDREHSAIAEADPHDFDYDEIMRNAQWFHWSGITPALSDNVAEITRLACEAAKRNGLTVSVDLNYREKLWSKEKAQSVMIPLMEYVDVYIGNEFHAQSALGFTPSSGSIAMNKTPEEFEKSLAELKETFGFVAVINAVRNSFSASKNGLKAFLYYRDKLYQSNYYEVEDIIGRVGAGDALTGGIIHGLLTKQDKQEALEFGVAASVLKLTVRGDFNQVSAEDVENFIENGGSGHIKR